MPYAGLDVHKRVVQATIVGDDGTVLRRHRFECTRAALITVASQLIGPDTPVALEATTNTWGIVDILKPYVKEVVVSNPLRTRAIAEAKVKTDKVDSEVLAQLLRCDFLPRVWEPDDHTKRLRHLTSYRAALVADCTRTKNRIHAVLHQRLIHPTVPELFNARGIAWLTALDRDDIDDDGRTAIDAALRMLQAVEREIKAMDMYLATLSNNDPNVKLLMTVPGVSMTVADTLIAALGDINRFRDGDHAASYLGLVPSTTQSANTCYHGPITKHGNSHARWMLVQAAQHLDKHPGPLGVFFRRLAKKKNRNVAVVATARKLVTICWHMLKHNEPYRYALPKPTETKLARLRVMATGAKRQTGSTKGKPRSPAYGTGQGTRLVPAIDHVYVSEGLAPLPTLSQGERKTVRAAHAQQFVTAIHQTHRIPRKGAQIK